MFAGLSFVHLTSEFLDMLLLSLISTILLLTSFSCLYQDIFHQLPYSENCHAPDGSFHHSIRCIPYYLSPSSLLSFITKASFPMHLNDSTLTIIGL